MRTATCAAPRTSGIEDGPDDAVESIRNWPLAHALGGPDSIIEQWDRAWEGHLDQYTKAKDPSTELAKDGMYYKEFPDLVRLGTHRAKDWVRSTGMG